MFICYHVCIIRLNRPVPACFSCYFRETMLASGSFISEKDAFYLKISNKSYPLVIFRENDKRKKLSLNILSGKENLNKIYTLC